MFFRLTPTALGVLCLLGCAATVDDYGVVLETGEVDEIAVVLPAEAPTIWRSYYPEEEDVRREEGPREHLGIDIIGPAGTPVIAPAAGAVVGSYFEPIYGNHVVIEHGEDEQGGSFVLDFFISKNGR